MVAVKKLRKLQIAAVGSVTVGAVCARVCVLVANIDTIVGSVTHGPAPAVGCHITVSVERSARCLRGVDGVHATRGTGVLLEISKAIFSTAASRGRPQPVRLASY